MLYWSVLSIDKLRNLLQMDMTSHCKSFGAGAALY